jgi:HK97 family phage major capsid protein
MSDRSEGAIQDLLTEIRVTRDAIATADATRLAAIAGKADQAALTRLGEEMARKTAALQAAVEQLSLKVGRPGGGGNPDTGAATLRQSARDLLQLKYEMRVTKSSPSELPYSPGENELEEAENAVRGLRHLMKATDISKIPLIEHKALTSFSMGASGFILVPEMSNQILSCLVDITDVTGMVSNVTISGPSIKFMVDNVRIDTAAWACETTCFANNAPGNFTEGLGEVEFKPEPLRYILCCGRAIYSKTRVSMSSNGRSPRSRTPSAGRYLRQQWSATASAGHWDCCIRARVSRFAMSA